MRAPALSAILALLALPACSSSSSSGGALPACTYASGVVHYGNTATLACSAARAYLSCTFSNGSGAGCLSDDPNGLCAGGSSTGGSGESCKDQCTASEYGVACGGPGQTWQPPAGCRALSANPGGSETLCCPCQ